MGFCHSSDCHSTAHHPHHHSHSASSGHCHHQCQWLQDHCHFCCGHHCEEGQAVTRGHPQDLAGLCCPVTAAHWEVPLCFRTKMCSPRAFQKEPLYDIPAGRTLQQRQWGASDCLSIDLLGSHPIKSTAFLGPCMPDALASPMLCSGKHDAQVPLHLSQDYCSG